MNNQKRFSGEWETKRFEELFRRLNGNFHKIQASEYSLNGPHPVIDQGQEAIVGYSDQTEKLFKCPVGGVIVFGDHTRIFKFVDVDFLIGADGTQLLAMKKDDMTKFFYYQLLIKDIPNTGYNRHFKFLKELTFKTPKLDEQRAIAEVLSDVDGLINALDALIAKKRAIKQATMQQLLTGKTRLPGFSGAWETKQLGHVAQIKTGSKNNEDKDDNGQYPLYVRSAVVERINSYCFDGEAILVPGEGGIENIFHYINGRFDCHQRVYMINRFVDDVFGKLIYYIMVLQFGRHAMQNTVKATVDSLRLPTFQTFTFSIPKDIAEQRAIATVLSDMGAEITALEQRRDKTIAIKQGMMQQLLTGRVRLVKSKNVNKT